MIQSATFWLVLAAATVVYWLLPARLRLGFLGLASFAYLAALETVGVVLLVGWTIVFFYLAPEAARRGRRGGLILAGLVGAILGYMIWQKYLPAILAMLADASPGVAIAVPLGISYYTFKLIHYAVESARGNIRDRSLAAFFCYIFLFPIFTAGPIERFDHFMANIAPRFDWQDMAEGATRIAHGLIKIFVFAKLVQPGIFGLGLPTNAAALTAGLGDFAVWQVWGFLILTYIYAYLDFSAYSDIAIGASRLFGIRILENFNFPILAANISEFWKRWHMTLAGWCQIYVYMPVLARARSPYAAVYATFTAMGLWHGATAGWLMWGLYHATCVALYMAWARHARRYGWWRTATRGRARYLGIPFTFLAVSASYAFSSTNAGGWMAVRVFLTLFGIRTD